MVRIIKKVQKSALLAAVIGTLFSFAGCTTITLVAPYDETTEKEATKIQKEIDGLITKMMSEGGEKPKNLTEQEEQAWQEKRRATLDYAKFQKEYEDISVSLRSLKIRTEAISQNENTSKQVGYIIANFELFETRHKQYSKKEVSSFSNGYLRNARNIMNNQFKSLLSLEIMKKRGEKADSSEVKEKE